MGQTFQFVSKAVAYMSEYLSRIWAILRPSITPMQPTNNTSYNRAFNSTPTTMVQKPTPTGALLKMAQHNVDDRQPNTHITN